MLRTMRTMNQWDNIGRDNMTIDMIRKSRTHTSVDIVARTNDASGLYPAWENPRTHTRYPDVPIMRNRGLRSAKIS